jgi:hypothetical protein
MTVRKLLASMGPLALATACGAQSGASGSGASSGVNTASGSAASSGVASSGTVDMTSGSASGQSSAGSTVVGPTSGVGGAGSTSGGVGGAGSTSASGVVAGSGASAGSGAGAGSGGGSGVGSGTSASAGVTSGSSSGGIVTPPMVDAGAATPIGDQTLPRKLYIENRCTYPVWSFAQPANTFPNSVPLKTDPGQAFVAGWPDKWQGRIWGRIECTGTGNVTCPVTNGPDTLAEFALTLGMASDWYDISLVDGFGVPTGILQLSAPWTPSPTYYSPAVLPNGAEDGGRLGADGICGSPICAADLLANCPASQQKKDAMGKVVACHNGDNGPGPIASYFKSGCPTSYSWPFDDPQSLFRCPDAAQNKGVGAKDYKIIYCPTQGATPGFP